jgi:uncharacterized protein
MSAALAQVQRIDVHALPMQRWKNGAGTTRDIARGPAGASLDDFDWRISLAELERDAPFSSFPGIERCIVLLQGAGMALRGDGGNNVQALRRLVPWTFDGELALSAQLTDGHCSDFNVMTRRGRWRADVRVLHGAAAVASGHVTLLLAVEGGWQVGKEAIEPMQALLWHGLEAPITVASRSTGTASALIHVRLCHDPFR